MTFNKFIVACLICMIFVAVYGIITLTERQDQCTSEHGVMVQTPNGYRCLKGVQ